MDKETTVKTEKQSDDLNAFDAHRRNTVVETGIITSIETDERTATLTVTLLYGDTQFTRTLDTDEANSLLDAHGLDPTASKIHDLKGEQVAVSFDDEWQLQDGALEEKSPQQAGSAADTALSVLGVLKIAVFFAKISFYLSPVFVLLFLVTNTALTGLLVVGGLAALKMGLTALEMLLWGLLLHSQPEDERPSIPSYVESYQERNTITERTIGLLFD